jgi:hypothetical protein
MPSIERFVSTRLIIYLASNSASKLEYGKDSAKRLADEPDETGNYALHIFLLNASYSAAEKKAKDKNDFNVNAECRISNCQGISGSKSAFYNIYCQS